MTSAWSQLAVIHLVDHDEVYDLGWAAPHFLVHLKWEFLERLHKSGFIQTAMRGLVLLLSQDALNSFGVAYASELCGRTAL